MKIISDKRRKRWAMFCVIVGSLTLFFSIYMANTLSPSLYFVVNSILLVLSGISLRYKKIIIYSILSFLLMISICVSLFYDSVLMSIIFSWIYIIPGALIFLSYFAILGSFLDSVKYLYGKIQYEEEISVLQDQPQIS